MKKFTILFSILLSLSFTTVLLAQEISEYNLDKELYLPFCSNLVKIEKVELFKSESVVKPLPHVTLERKSEFESEVENIIEKSLGPLTTPPLLHWKVMAVLNLTKPVDAKENDKEDNVNTKVTTNATHKPQTPPLLHWKVMAVLNLTKPVDAKENDKDVTSTTTSTSTTKTVEKPMLHWKVLEVLSRTTPVDKEGNDINVTKGNSTAEKTTSYREKPMLHWKVEQVIKKENDHIKD